MSATIETTKLTKHYGPVVAVEDLNLTLHEGEVFGLLGPNGSGKTTTILMLLGLAEPTSGEARVLGVDPARQPLEVKRRVGYLPDSVGFYDDLTATENLNYIARLNGLTWQEAGRRGADVLKRMGLSDVAERRVGTYSRGMRQRLGLAEVLLKQPKVAILDEPTLGLDPEAANEFLRLILDLKRDGLVVLLSSHLLHQVQVVCDRVGLFHKGQMVLEGTVDALADQVLGGAYRINLEVSGDGLGDALTGTPGVATVTREGPTRYRIEARTDCRAEIARRIVTKGTPLLSLSLERPGLDEVYTRHFHGGQYEA
jgi:ABC-2 type transport system ATP-binding protein